MAPNEKSWQMTRNAVLFACLWQRAQVILTSESDAMFSKAGEQKSQCFETTHTMTSAVFGHGSAPFIVLRSATVARGSPSWVRAPSWGARRTSLWSSWSSFTAFSRRVPLRSPSSAGELYTCSVAVSRRHIIVRVFTGHRVSITDCAAQMRLPLLGKMRLVRLKNGFRRALIINEPGGFHFQLSETSHVDNNRPTMNSPRTRGNVQIDIYVSCRTIHLKKITNRWWVSTINACYRL